MNNLNAETIATLSQAFLDEFNLWEKTGGNTILPKIDDFLVKVTNTNVLLFNTKKTMSDVKVYLTKDADTQDAVLLFLARIKFRFISYGGEWKVLIDALQEVSGSVNKDNSFESIIDGYEQTAPITETTMLQALLYFYILSPNIIITRGVYVKRK